MHLSADNAEIWKTLRSLLPEMATGKVKDLSKSLNNKRRYMPWPPSAAILPSSPLDQPELCVKSHRDAKATSRLSELEKAIQRRKVSIVIEL